MKIKRGEYFPVYNKLRYDLQRAPAPKTYIPVPKTFNQHRKLMAQIQHPNLVKAQVPVL